VLAAIDPHPDLLILDEPHHRVDPLSATVWDLIDTIRSQASGMTLLVPPPIWKKPDALRLAGAMDDGAILADRFAPGIKQQPKQTIWTTPLSRCCKKQRQETRCDAALRFGERGQPINATCLP